MTEKQKSQAKRTQISRDALERALAEAVRSSHPQCENFNGVIIERRALVSAGSANWGLKGVKFGKADRSLCGAELTKCLEEGLREFQLSD